MMRIDDRQLRFEDRLVFLFCEPRIVGLAALTKPARLNGLRHDEVPISPILHGFPGSVMAIVSLFTSAAKLSVVTESSGGKRCPRQGRSQLQDSSAIHRAREARYDPDADLRLTLNNTQHGDLRVREHFDRLCQGFNNNFPMTWPLSSSACARPAWASGSRSWITGRMRPAARWSNSTVIAAARMSGRSSKLWIVKKRTAGLLAELARIAVKRSASGGPSRRP